MKGLGSKIFLTCKKATELMEKQQVASLNLLEYMCLTTHLHICKVCKQYHFYSKKLDQIFKQLYHFNNPSGNAEKLQQQIKSKLEML